MKLTKKLLPALGMLALSTCMMVTSTFAWFSMNTEVTAKGMTVTAQADQIFLQINNANTFNDNSSMLDTTATKATAALYPTAVVEELKGDKSVTAFRAGSQAKDTVAWVKNYSEAVEDHEGVANNYTAIGDADNFYLVNTFYIRLNPSAGNDTAQAPLKSSVSLTITKEEGTDEDEANDLIAQSVSVLVVCGDYAQLWKQTALNTWNNVADGDLTGGANFQNTKVGEEQAGSYSGAVPVQVYVFFDGENENCTTKNYSAIEALGYAITVSFNVTKNS